MDKKVDKLLEGPYKSAMDFFNVAVTCYMHNDHRRACKELENVIVEATRAFYLVGKFQQKVHCKWLLCQSRILTLCYDEETKEIKPLHTQKPERKKLIADLVFKDIKELLDEFQKVKKPRGPLRCWRRKDKRKEQDQMNRLLKIMLPIMWPHIEVFEEILSIYSADISDEAKKLMEHIDSTNKKMSEGWRDKAREN